MSSVINNDAEKEQLTLVIVTKRNVQTDEVKDLNLRLAKSSKKNKQQIQHCIHI